MESSPISLMPRQRGHCQSPAAVLVWELGSFSKGFCMFFFFCLCALLSSNLQPVFLFLNGQY